MSLPNPAELLPRMASDLRAHLAERGIERPRFVGIHTGGIWVAEALLRNWATKSRWAPSTSPSTATTSPRTACIRRSARRRCRSRSTASTWCWWTTC